MIVEKQVVVIVLVIFFLCSLHQFQVSAVEQNRRPIIGVLAQPTSEGFSKFGKSYIAASYVKFVEGAGARVVPIDYNWSFDKIKSIFHQINGVLFPGGGASLKNTTRYFEIQQLFMDLAVEANDKNDYFPIWATCLGFEAIVKVVSKDDGILSSFDAWNISLPLDFVDGFRDSKLFGKQESPAVPIEQYISILQQEAVTLNNHHAGVSLQDFNHNSHLSEFFKVLSLNKDRKGATFISTIEAKKYPIYGTQWHPEKPLYEWHETEEINHSHNSVLVNQHFANFFVNEARKNNHRFSTREAEWESLIYQHQPVFTYPMERDFVQCYFF